AGRKRRHRNSRLRAAGRAALPVLHARVRRSHPITAHGGRQVTDIEMARIAAGAVTLHDARRKNRRTVEPDACQIGVYPVTREQMAEILGITALHPRRPASDLSWLRAVRVCNAASDWEGLEPAYTFDGEVVTWHIDSDGYRLP